MLSNFQCKFHETTANWTAFLSVIWIAARAHVPNVGTGRITLVSVNDIDPASSYPHALLFIHFVEKQRDCPLQRFFLNWLLIGLQSSQKWTVFSWEPQSSAVLVIRIKENCYFRKMEVLVQDGPIVVSWIVFLLLICRCYYQIGAIKVAGECKKITILSL